MSRLQTPVRRNDNVKVVAGRDRGKSGRVLRIIPDTNRLVVEGVNFVKRHTKPNPGKNIKGGIVEREASVTCPMCNFSVLSVVLRLGLGAFSVKDEKYGSAGSVRG